MAGKGASKSPSKGATDARQRTARKKARAYFDKLGLRKLAKRLEARVPDVRAWLEGRKQLPPDKLRLAYALDKPGGLQVTVRGSKIGALVEAKGKRAASELTGLSLKALNERLRKPNSTVKIERDKLRKLIKDEGIDGARKALGASPKEISKANKIPSTKATERLRAFADEHGDEKAARYLGITERQLKGWLKTNIPFAWEELVNWKLGRPTKNTPTGPSPNAVSTARRPSEKQIAAAVEQARRWNERVPRRFRISLKNAERWARTGTFAQRFDSTKAAYEASKKPLPPSKPRPAPTPPKRPPIIPPSALPGAKPGKPGKKPPAAPPSKPPPPPPPSIDLALEDKKRDFLQARLEAFTSGRYPTPIAPWGRITSWKLNNRKGIHLYKKVEEFVHRIDLDKMKAEMSAAAIKVWNQLKGEDPQMTIRCVFSAMGNGNPFYPDAFQEGDDVNFFNTNIYIRPSDEPEKTLKEHVSDRIAEKLQDIYIVDTEDVLLYWEYYEVIKSALI